MSKCDCGENGHQDQLQKFPKGIKVVATCAFSGAPDEIVPEGAVGTVVGRCNDGRVYVRFAEPYDGAGHTFHHPSSFIKLQEDWDDD